MPDNTFEVFVDQDLVNSGSLLEDMTYVADFFWTAFFMWFSYTILFSNIKMTIIVIIAPQ